MTVNKIFHKSRDVGFGRSIMNREEKSISRVSIPREQSAAPSMMELVLYNQVSTRCLVYPVRECYPNWDSVLIFVIGRLDTQQWMQPVGPDKWENHVVEPMNDHPCYYGHFFMSPWEEWVTRQIGWLMFTGWIILPTWLWRSSLLFGEHLNWKQIYIYFLPI